MDQTLSDIISDPTAYGFTDVTSPCFVGGTVCPTPSNHLFWDTLHPTTAAHSLLGRAMANAVPGPLPALGGVVAFRWTRRLRRRMHASTAPGIPRQPS
jgi:phospholipase/lecithinase/hemolysin